MSIRQGFRFSAALQEMAASEIMSMIDPATLAAIKQSDPKPLIKAFVVGHEGESKGNVVGFGNVVKRWYRSMVRTLGAKIRRGLQLFHGHGATNDQDGRVPVGQVLGSVTKEHEGRESVIVACHIFKPFAHLPLDVASIEAQAEFEQAPDGKLDIASIGEVTAIALGNSSVNQPGFPGATLLGQLQAFEAKTHTEPGPRLRLGFTNIDKGRLPRVKLV